MWVNLSLSRLLISRFMIFLCMFKILYIEWIVINWYYISGVVDTIEKFCWLILYELWSRVTKSYSIFCYLIKLMSVERVEIEK